MTTELVGRRWEVGLVERAMARAREGLPQLLVIGGAAGIGKTRLLDHCASRLAAAGVRVLRGGCVEVGGGGVPLAPITSTLRDLLLQLGPERLTSLLPGAGPVLGLLPELGPPPELGPLPELGLLPVLGPRSDPVPGQPVPETQVRPVELYAGLLRQLAADQPVFLVIDDLHWADRSTRDLLGLLARTLRGTRVAVAVAYRSDRLRPGDPLPGFLAELARLPGVQRRELAGFGRAETEQLLTAVLGAPAPPALADQILTRSGGNPFFIEQLARASGADSSTVDGYDPGQLPVSLRDLLLDRVEPLPAPARRVVQLVAVAGEPVPHRLLAAVAGLSGGALLAAIRSTVDAGVLATTVDDGYEVRPGLLREAVLAELLPAERVHLHRRYAGTLERRPELLSTDRLGAWLAYQWHGAGEPRRAVPAAHEAAAAAETRHAYRERSRLLRLALELPPATAADRRRAAAAALRAGEPGQALALLDGPDLDDAGTLAMSLALRCRALHEHGDAGAASAAGAATEALRALPATAPAVRAGALDLLATVLAERGQPEAAQALARESAGLGDARTAASARLTLATALAALGSYEEALEAFGAERDLAARDGDPLGLARAHAGLAATLTLLGRLPEAIATARASPGAEPGLRLAEALLIAGDWEAADQAAVAALALDPPRLLAVALHALRGEVALGRGEPELAGEQRSLAETLLARISGAVPEALPVACLRAELALGEHRIDEARKAIAEVLPVTRECRVPLASWRLLVTGARVEARARVRARAFGDELTGESLAPALRQAAAGLPTGTPPLAGYAGWFAAEWVEPDQHPGAHQRWSDLAAGWDAIGAPHPASYARLRAAEAAVGAGDRAVAQRWLREAAAGAERWGAVPLLADIRRLARGADIPLDPQRSDEVSELRRLRLTGREAQVLRLMVAGRTNRQIAQQLYISPKTASVHASRILAKLGVSNRVEAAATAYRLRLFDDAEGEPPGVGAGGRGARGGHGARGPD